MNPQTPLRYRISSWRQLPECKSNNSKKFSIHVADICSNPEFNGFRISVEHELFGNVFTCVLNARGYIVSGVGDIGEYEFTNEQILAELAKYGFLITYIKEPNLSGSQIQYLMTLRDLGYDKIRIISVWDSVACDNEPSYKVVAFQSTPLGDWLNNAYSPSTKEFTQALVNGTAVNLTFISRTRDFDWSWLRDFVGNIDDIIQDNAHDMIYTEG